MPEPPHRCNKHLRADAGYRSADNLRTIELHGYIRHVMSPRNEADLKRRNLKKKARRGASWNSPIAGSIASASCLRDTRNSNASFVAFNHPSAAISVSPRRTHL